MPVFGSAAPVSMLVTTRPIYGILPTSTLALMFVRLSSASVWARLPNTVPSLGATSYIYFAARKLPAPGMFCVMIVGLPGKCRGRNSATSRP
jgi:hypothetical protein